MRIVAGKHRGRAIAVPPGRDVRPTADRVREAVFNSLCHGNARIGDGDAVRGAIVLDAFAGTGAMGLEAVSRGAEHVTLMDIDPTALAACRRNVAALGEQDRVAVLGGDCLHAVRPARPCDLVFLDPPYRSGLAGAALAALADAGWIAPGALCVAETAANETVEAPDRFAVLDERRYGAARITYLTRSPADGPPS